MRKILHAQRPRQTARPFVRLLAWVIAVMALSNIAFASYLATMFVWAPSSNEIQVGCSAGFRCAL